jgi:nitrogen-specific signal transduction histidine kinase
VKDLGIGVGLSNSKELCSALTGNVRLVSSNKGHTEFEIKIPVFNDIANENPE